jgi:hypothetical protein
MKAHGVKDAKPLAFRGKNKGTLHVMGVDLEMTQEITVQPPGKFKEIMDLSVMGQTIHVATVYNGKDAWIKRNGEKVDVTDEIRNELLQASYMLQLSQGLLAKDKSLKLSLLGEAKVNDKPAVGVKVEKEGKKPIDFYFDKETGLIAKTQRQVKDMSGQDVTEERIVKEYQDVNGRKMAKKVEVKRGGNPFMEVEVVETKLVDKVDDSEFVEP